MKKIVSLLAFLFVGLMLAGCPPKETECEGSDCGDAADVYGWHMTQWEIGGATSEMPKDVYVKFNTDGGFELYQDITGPFTKYTGTYSFDGTTLSGTYSDGQAWAHSYTVSGVSKVTFESTDAAATMVMTATDDATNKSSFASGVIPAGVIDDATPYSTAATRGAEVRFL